MTLANKMRTLAQTPGFEQHSAALKAKAAELDSAVERQSETGGTKRLLGAWARARRLYCELSGEPLI